MDYMHNDLGLKEQNMPQELWVAKLGRLYILSRKEYALGNVKHDVFSELSPDCFFQQPTHV